MKALVFGDNIKVARDRKALDFSKSEIVPDSVILTRSELKELLKNSFIAGCAYANEDGTENEPPMDGQQFISSIIKPNRITER